MPSDNAYMAKYVGYRYLVLKLKVIELKGGKCQKCGYNRCHGVLVLHHRDPTEKEFNWVKLRKQSWATILREIEKCDLLCANCHGEVHHDPAVIATAISYMDSKKKEPKLSGPTVFDLA